MNRCIVRPCVQQHERNDHSVVGVDQRKEVRQFMRKYSQRFNRIQSQQTFFSTDVSLAKKEHTGTLQGARGRGTMNSTGRTGPATRKQHTHKNILLREKNISFKH